MMITYKRFLVLSVCALQLACGQVEKNSKKAQEFPFTSEHWRVENADDTESEIKTMNYKNRSAIKLEPSRKANVKNKKFKNFIMDFYLNGLSGPGFGFRVQDRKNYDYLYLRLGLSGKKDALLYVPVHNGNLPWQLYNYPKYEGKATFPKKKVATFPASLKQELVEGKASDKLKKLLSEKGFSFTEESEIVFGNEVVRYIFDPKKMEALLFEEIGDSIVFLNPRTWIHVKVEVIGDRASFYIEDMETAAFVVDNLKRPPIEGGISLIGDGAGTYFADLTITELQKSKIIDDTSSKEKLSDTYLTEWNVSEMFTKDSLNFEAQVDSLFQNKSKFKPVQADADGLVNISRFCDDMTKTVALTCNLVSNADKAVQLNFDYAHHLVILLNSEIIFDKGMNFQPPEEKGEEGRVFVDDESVELDLKKGKNQLVFMLSADNRQKFNWGFVAKLAHMEGISIGN